MKEREEQRGKVKQSLFPVSLFGIYIGVLFLMSGIHTGLIVFMNSAGWNKAVMQLFETLMTREERLRSEDMGQYFRVAADNRDLNYDKFVVKGEVHTMADESYTSHNTTRLDVEGTVKKIMTTEYVQNELKGIPNV